MTRPAPALAQPPSRWNQILRHPWALPGLAWAAYVAGHPLARDLLDTHAGVTAFVPVVITAWYHGALIGGPPVWRLCRSPWALAC